MIKLSVITTLFKSGPHVYEFYHRISEAAKYEFGDSYELLFVDDGSPDDSFEKALKLRSEDSKVKVVQLSRNFGHHTAMMAGLEHASGSLIFLIDSDLEEDPNWLSDFRRRMDEDGCDVVFGVQEQRRETGISRLFGTVFYMLMAKFSPTFHPKNPVTARLMTKKYVADLLKMREQTGVASNLWSWVGYDQREANVIKLQTSPSNYSFARKFFLSVKALTTVSPVLLNFALAINFLVSVFLAAISCGWLFYSFYSARPTPGWASLLLMQSFVFVLNSCCLFLIGLYVSYIFTEVRNRPNFLTKSLHGFD